MIIKASPDIWAIVPAAGIGRRMGSEIPKQYLQLAGKSILENTLEKLLSLNDIKGIVLALHPDDSFWGKTALSDHPKIHCVTGGCERSESVTKALQYCSEQGVSDASWALVHDAARPCVSTDKIRALITHAQGLHETGECVGAILAAPASDTIKRVNNTTIVKTEDRAQLWLAHTPQFFTISVLLNALETCQRKKLPVTDEASAIEALGMAVGILEDRRDNIKVTAPEDLLWAETILMMQRKNNCSNTEEGE